MHDEPSLAETCERILREREPNFFRLYLNPHLAQTCFCLDRYVRTTWTSPMAAALFKQPPAEDCQSFLANGMEEALSGALKLARFNRHAMGRRSTGLVLDPADRLIGFAGVDLKGGEQIEFLPGLRVIGKNQLGMEPGTLGLESSSAPDRSPVDSTIIDPLVLVAGADTLLEKHADFIRAVVRKHQPLVITCIDRESLTSQRRGATGIVGEVVPDIVVFDESFVNHAVPFAAFTARHVAVRMLEPAWQSHVSLDDVPAEYHFNPAFHALSLAGRPGICQRSRRAIRERLHRFSPPRRMVSTLSLTRRFSD